jgi:hypothetical protein
MNGRSRLGKQAGLEHINGDYHTQSAQQEKANTKQWIVAQYPGSDPT